MELPERSRIVPPDAFDNRARMLVGRGRFRPLLLGHGHHAEREHLIDFGRIEKSTWAFRCDGGIVGQDNRRRQRHITTPRRANEHRPGTFADARSYGGLGVRRRIEHGDELSLRHVQQQVTSKKRLAQRLCAF
jgi:hypothetical protein